MTVCALNIPLPPTSNNMFFNRPHGGRGKTTEYKAWREAAAWAIKTQRPPLFKGDVCITLLIERPTVTSDLDNRIKACCDALQSAGVIENDNRIIDIHARWAPIKGCAVTIMSSVESEAA